MKAIDGDSHFMEPMDLFERYIDPAFRERTVRMASDPETGKAEMLADGKALRLRDVDQIMGILVGYGEKEQGLNIGNFDRYLGYSQQWQDMDARVRFLDEEGFAKQVLYPSLGIIWEGEVEDPALFALASWQVELRRRMLSTAGREQGRWARLVELSYDTLGYLEQNVSPRLALETFLLECRKAS